MLYAGWIPTVTGNLSFSTIGLGSFPTQCWKADWEGNSYILQRRDLLDALVPYAETVEVARFFRELLANYVVGISGRFQFLAELKVSTDGESCSGCVYVVPVAKNRRFCNSVKRWMKNGEQELSQGESPISQVREKACYCADVQIQRKGKVTISLNVELKDDENGALPHLLANQIFFFLKDISHVHQHHEPTHDAIIEVSRIEDSNRDDSWIAKTQYSLYRAIIRYKRFRNERALFRASGILAYANAFQKSYAIGEVPGSVFHVEELERSLAVSREEIKHFDQKRLSRIETFRNFLFAACGLIVSVTYLARLGEIPDIDVEDGVVWLAVHIAEEPLGFFGAITLLSILYSVVTHRIEPADNQIVRWITRVLQGLRLRWFVITNIALTAIFAWFCYLLLT